MVTSDMKARPPKIFVDEIFFRREMKNTIKTNTENDI